MCWFHRRAGTLQALHWTVHTWVRGKWGHGLLALCQASAVHGSPVPQVGDAHCAVLATGQHGVAIRLQCAAQHRRKVLGQAPVCPLRHPARVAAQHKLSCHTSLVHCGALAQGVRFILEALAWLRARHGSQILRTFNAHEANNGMHCMHACDRTRRDRIRSCGLYGPTMLVPKQP